MDFAPIFSPKEEKGVDFVPNPSPKEVKRIDFAPIPSPRVKKKARKEQMLLEHKEKGHQALSMVMKQLKKPEDELSTPANTDRNYWRCVKIFNDFLSFYKMIFEIGEPTFFVI